MFCPIAHCRCRSSNGAFEGIKRDKGGKSGAPNCIRVSQGRYSANCAVEVSRRTPFHEGGHIKGDHVFASQHLNLCFGVTCFTTTLTFRLLIRRQLHDMSGSGATYVLHSVEGVSMTVSTDTLPALPHTAYHTLAALVDCPEGEHTVSLSSFASLADFFALFT